MKSADTRMLVLLAIFSVALTGPSWGGSEIGNARYVPFKNLSGDFQTKYPKTWENIDLGEIVGFSESDMPTAKGSNVAISFNSLPEIQTQDDLRAMVTRAYPDSMLSSIILDGKKGFFLLNQGRAQIYILRNGGVVF